MAWHESENRSSVKPESVDNASSRIYTIVRKQFEELPTYDDEGHQIGTHWRYLENFVPKDQYELYVQTQQQQADLDYIAMMADVEL